MKTRFFLFIFVCMLSVVRTTAQRPNTPDNTHYYDVTKTFYENGYTYQCDVKGINVTLYNKNNQFTYAKQTFKDGSPLSEKYLDGEIDFLEDDTWTKAKCFSIVNIALASGRLGHVRGEKIFVTMFISPETGKVIEVNFWFFSHDKLGTIPVSDYRQVETKLKNDVWFTPTAEGKKLNYIMRGWMQELTGGSRQNNDR